MEVTIKELNKKKVLVIGGGPAGLTAAYELSKRGMEPIVFEKDQIVGGISRTVNYKDYYFDIGGHRFFSKVKRVEDVWNEILANDLLYCNRLSRIFYNKKFFFYPFKPINAFFGLGLWESILILSSYFYAHVFPLKEEETFEQWVINRFGKHLYNTFFKTYTEKVWGIPCKEIRAEWAAQRIKGLSLLKAITNTFIKQKNNGSKETVIKTLIDSFHYPKLGPGMMWQTLSEIMQEKGSKVCLGSVVEKILWDRNANKVNSIEVRTNGQSKLYKGTDFINSMPIRELIQKFKPCVPDEVLEAANCLKYRDFITVALFVKKRNIFPDNWIYIHDPSVKLGRIQNFKNWSQYMVPDPNKTCLGLEYFCFEGDELWTMSDKELVEFGKKELGTLGLAQACEVEDGTVVRMPKAYPVYDSNYRESIQIVRQFLSRIDNLQTIGRNGMHKYNNQDHSMLTGMLAVENIYGSNHDLWEVNTDQEYHEEVMDLDEKDSIRQRVLIETLMKPFARIDKLAFAIAIGSLSGLLIFLVTILVIVRGDGAAGSNFQLLSQYFLGYTVTIRGSFIAMGYCFVWGFLFGWLFAYLRNLFITFYLFRIKRKAQMLSFRDFLDHF